MKVLILSSAAVEEVNDSYGARLIEQGKAVIPPKAQEKKAPPKAETGEAPEEKPAPKAKK